MSQNQIRALEVLAKSGGGIVEAVETSGRLGLKGKSLGGVFSAISRQKINGLSLIVAWGRGRDGRGLRWKLNEKLIDQKSLLAVVKELLA